MATKSCSTSVEMREIQTKLKVRYYSHYLIKKYTIMKRSDGSDISGDPEV